MKVTLIGDSIRMVGYGPLVPKMLGDEFEVFQPSENCRFSKYTMRGVMHDWKEFMAGSQIIHWNNGLWDTCDLFGDGPFSSYEEYEANMLRILKVLKTYTDKIIFATTTPVLPAHARCANPTIEEYNKRIVPVLKAHGVVINDLHTLVYDNLDEYIRHDDNIHLTEVGAKACAQRVVDCILAAKKEIEQGK